MVGDAASDVQAALAAKAKPIFLLTGLAERLEPELAQARLLNAAIYPDLAAAVWMGCDSQKFSLGVGQRAAAIAVAVRDQKEGTARQGVLHDSVAQRRSIP